MYSLPAVLSCRSYRGASQSKVEVTKSRHTTWTIFLSSQCMDGLSKPITISC